MTAKEGHKKKNRPNLLAAAALGAFTGLATSYGLHDIGHITSAQTAHSLAFFDGIDAAVLTGAVTAGKWNRAILPATAGLVFATTSVLAGYSNFSAEAYGGGLLAGYGLEAVARDVFGGRRSGPAQH